MVVGGSQQETLDPGFVLLGTRQQGVPIILGELERPGGFDLVSIRDVTTELSEPVELKRFYGSLTVYSLRKILLNLAIFTDKQS
ncbi:unnamed protein product [Schistosoma margrebowiei]|uniref:Uncharacterized protein n=1 Tax=Schistosoma margrebowiei TaxID=48269 RepID=A0A183LA53_9TREM|nr:unnamed protein product [Schistosoma margrebowiei]